MEHSSFAFFIYLKLLYGVVFLKKCIVYKLKSFCAKYVADLWLRNYTNVFIKILLSVFCKSDILGQNCFLCKFCYYLSLLSLQQELEDILSLIFMTQKHSFVSLKVYDSLFNQAVGAYK